MCRLVSNVPLDTVKVLERLHIEALKSAVQLQLRGFIRFEHFILLSPGLKLTRGPVPLWFLSGSSVARFLCSWTHGSAFPPHEHT